jgi:hypothetical protein
MLRASETLKAKWCCSILRQTLKQYHPLATHSVPARGRWTRDVCRYCLPSKDKSLSFSQCLHVANLSPFHSIMLHINRPPHSSLNRARRGPRHTIGPFSFCTIKTLIFMHFCQESLLSRLYFVHVFRRHAINLCCWLLLYIPFLPDIPVDNHILMLCGLHRSPPYHQRFIYRMFKLSYLSHALRCLLTWSNPS